MKFINFDVTSDFPELIEADHVTRPSDPIWGPKKFSPGFYPKYTEWFADPKHFRLGNSKKLCLKQQKQFFFIGKHMCNIKE